MAVGWRGIAMWGWLLLAAPAQAATVVVGVMEFANQSPQSDWDPLGKGFQEMFLVDLAKAGSVEIVPRTTLRDTCAALGVTPPGGRSERRKVASKAGADFLLSGGFLVKGASMALEIELLDAKTGSVVLTDRQEGEAEGFFELQKSALKASLRALSVSLTPRERAETGRLHTADFLAFQDFSRGLDYFDAERYEAGLRSLREATERDAEFSLARITLEAYEQLVSSIRQKAAAVGVVRAEQERMERLAAAGDAVEVVRRLLDIAATHGDAARRERLTALYLLSFAMTGEWRREKPLREYYAVEDRFAMRRASEQLAQRYHAEAKPLWPALPVRVDAAFVRSFPSSGSFEADFAEAVTFLWERGVDSANNRQSYLLDNLEYPRELAAQLRLTVSEEIARFDEHLRLADELGAPDWWVRNQREEMVKELRRDLRFDDSTRILQDFAAASDNEWALKGFAEEIETNRGFVAMLTGARNRRWMEEWVRQGIADYGSLGPVEGGAALFSGASRSDEARQRLTAVREWPRESYLFVDDVPVWIKQPFFWFSPGPMSDPRRTEQVRYHRESSDALDGLLFVGAEPYAAVDVGVTFDRRVPDDFWPGRKERGVAEGEPAVAVLVGLVDLDVPLQRDPVTGDDHLTRPMRGIAVWVRDGELQIVRTVETKRGGYERKAEFSEEVLARTRLGGTDGAFRVDVAVRGRTVVAKVRQRSVKATLKEPVVGYAGLQFRGHGYVGAGELAVRPRR